MKIRILLPLFLLTVALASASEPVPVCHGVAVPVNSSCGMVTTELRNDDKVVLSFLGDASGCPCILQINLTRHRHFTVKVPAAPKPDMQPMASLLSSRNLYYAAFNGAFYEYDPECGAFTFQSPVSGQICMGLTEDRQGRIWCGSWPGGEICCFDPATRKLTDYGVLLRPGWAVYQRYLACDDEGWLYFGIGRTEAQIYAFHADTRELRAIIPPKETVPACIGEVHRGVDGKVYGWMRTKNTPYFELHGGRATRLETKPDIPLTTIEKASGTQFLKDDTFADGSRVVQFDTVNRFLRWCSPDGVEHRETFNYPSVGVNIMGIEAMADGTIRGGAAHPMRYFIYDIASSTFAGGDARFQWNAVLADGDRLWIGGYPGGALIEWNTRQAYQPRPAPRTPDRRLNPATHGMGENQLLRPSAIRKMPDGRMVMAGTPGYGCTGGGLIVYDPADKHFEVIPKEALFGTPSALSLLPLSDSQILIGGTTSGGTGGREAEGDAPMMIYDLNTRQAVWQGCPLAGAKSYLDLIRLPDGQVLGTTDRTRLFVFDPIKRTVTREIRLEPGDRTVWQQGPRILLSDGERFFVLLEKKIMEFLPTSGKLVTWLEVPSGITAGGAMAGGRIYYVKRSRLWSVPYKTNKTATRGRTAARQSNSVLNGKE
ncbi:MAG: hypothetical protein IJC73_00395 [Lentisphaeria bacterium]|nr:hypothetical protein [Lentisphaeria bacterium]